ATGNIYVGQADGSKNILKFDASGKLLASFAPETSPRGTDWIDLASDQCTMHYTSEGSDIKQYNVCTKTQLPAFATGLPGPCYAHRILADGSELVACTTVGEHPSAVVEHVSAGGVVLHTYAPDSAPLQYLFALNLDPDGTSFWTGDKRTTGVWKIDIATGKILTTFEAGFDELLGGLAIVGEITAGTKQRERNTRDGP